MSDQQDRPPNRLSRRRLLKNTAIAAGGVAAFTSFVCKRAEAKAAQKLVGYQETPHGAQECDNCAQFEAPSSCKVVDGTISPKGWCKVYVKKPGS